MRCCSRTEHRESLAKDSRVLRLHDSFVDLVLAPPAYCRRKRLGESFKQNEIFRSKNRD
jgi:hypothetical protein